MNMEESIAHSLIAVSKKYLSAFSRRIADLPLDRYQYVLLLIDEHAQNLTQKALAELMLVDKSYMVIILDYLTEKGYVVREKNPDDRREQIVRLTDKARTDVPVIKKAISDLNNKSLQNLTKDQIAIFNEVLQAMHHNLSDSVPTEIRFDFKKL